MIGNTFTIDAWINPTPDRGSRYLGICGSFSQYYFPAVEGSTPGSGIPEAVGKDTRYFVGWSLYFNVTTSKLQMVGYNLGSSTNLILESNFTISTGTWTHITLMAWKDSNTNHYVRMFFKNGIPDLQVINDTCIWNNAVDRSSIGTQLNSYAPFYIGVGAKSSYTDSGLSITQALNIVTGYHFKGFIRDFCLSETAKFAVTGFTPPVLPIVTTSTQSTASTSTTSGSTTSASTITLSTTAPPEVNVASNGQPIASSSSFDGPPGGAFDSNTQTKWKPSGSGNDWVGIDFTRED
jgi:hypothetical protein